MSEVPMYTSETTGQWLQCQANDFNVFRVTSRIRIRHPPQDRYTAISIGLL